MFPSLNLSLSFGSKKSWMYAQTQSVNGQPLSRDGVKIVEGWDFSWRNGFAFAGPVNKVYKLGNNGDTLVFGKIARQARTNLRQKSRDYTRDGRSLMKRLMLEILSLPLKILAFIITLISLPIYIIAYIISAVVILFWKILILMAA